MSNNLSQDRGDEHAATLVEVAGNVSGRDCKHVVVGIGASAGGLEALEKLFASMPTDTGMSFVVVQHLSPDFKSHMKELLGRVTGLPIHACEDGMAVEPNAIYLIPPKMEMAISSGKLLLTERNPDRAFTHPIDQFFRALANDCQGSSVGIVLSGTGSDGSRGIAAIRESGGLVIVQDPPTCAFDSMPRNALETGAVDLTLPPEEIGDALQRYLRDGLDGEKWRDRRLLKEAPEGIERILQLVQESQGIDFSHYKSGTIGRRIQRRMDALRIESLEEYQKYLEQHSDEATALYCDFLIGVTHFFRDEEAFAELEKNVIPEIVRRQREAGIRVWVCGCATGEEAYSLAMLFAEAQEQLGIKTDIKIFATDAHHESLQYAANGVYPEEQLKLLSPARRNRFFQSQRDGYQVASELRQMLVFAPHNILTDPPFTKVDLVTCRNLLIYLQQSGQRKALSLFHFAMRASGFLFLGPSESPGEIDDEFETISSRWKIYRKRRDIRLPIETRMPLTTPATGGRNLMSSAAKGQISRENRELMAAVYDTLVSELMPPSVLVDSEFEILHTFSGAERFLNFPTGRPSANLLDVVQPSLKTALGGALQHALKDQTRVRYSGLSNSGDSAGQQLRIVVEPKPIPAVKMTTLLVKFESIDSAPDPAVRERETDDVNVQDASSTRISALESELEYTRQNLQATIEELETSNEELQASNEEMVASNEELQATNEELHSVNEELYTVNAEHQRKVDELTQANNDMFNLLASTQVGVIFLDQELHIRRFTPEIARVFHLVPQDIGRSISCFAHRLQHDNILAELEEVLVTGSAKELHVADTQGQEFLIRMVPYSTDRTLEGVTVAFIDVTSLRAAERGVEKFKFMCDSAHDSQALLDGQGNLVYVNPAMCHKLGYSEAELLQMKMTDIDPAFDIARVWKSLEARAEAEPFESEHLRKDRSSFPVEVSATAFDLAGQAYVYATIRDLTSRKKTDAELRLLQKAIASVDGGILLADAREEDNPIVFASDGFYRLTGYQPEQTLGKNCRFLQCEKSDPTVIAKMRSAIAEREACHVLILNQKADGTEFWNDLTITPVRGSAGEVTHFVGVQQDVTERVLIGERARESEETMRLLLDSTAEGIFGIDREGRCTFCNKSAANMLGYTTPGDLVGRLMHDTIHHTRPDGSAYRSEYCPIKRAVTEGLQVNEANDSFWRADGTSFPVEYWSHPILHQGKPVGGVVTFVDITSRRAGQVELKKARRQADAANRAKSQFLANMSHELRSPMAAVLGFAEILQGEITNPSHLERLATIRRNGDYLLRLLDDVLDLSKIEVGALKIRRVTFQLPTFIADLHHMMQLRATELGRSLRFHCPVPLPENVMTDPARLRQVLVNLIGNGLKFSPRGRVDVTFRLRQREEEDRLEISVKDTGIGIPEERLGQIFQPFSQANDNTSTQFGGSGLGLSISKRLIESMQGEIRVASKVGRGSTFTIEVPVGNGERRALIDCGQLRESFSEIPGGKGKFKGPKIDGRVLVADDRRDICHVAQHFLEKSGCGVDVAENGSEALEQILRAEAAGQPYDAILMDLNMPVMDGEQAVQKLRSSGVTTPIIALTADAMKGARRRVLKAGFDEYLTKPIESQSLLTIVEQVIKERKEGQQS